MTLFLKVNGEDMEGKSISYVLFSGPWGSRNRCNPNNPTWHTRARSKITRAKIAIETVRELWIQPMRQSRSRSNHNSLLKTLQRS